MQRTIAGSFRTDAAINNLIDSPNFATAGWTAGATLIDKLSANPNVAQSWNILGFSISFNLALFFSQHAGFAPSYGVLGKVFAALLLGAQPTPADANLRPWVNPMLPLPNDLSTLISMWDGSQDAPPPQISTTGAFQPIPIVGSSSLPQPVRLDPGDNMALGIWLTPSLGQNAQLYVLNGQYTVTYDDGRK